MDISHDIQARTREITNRIAPQIENVRESLTTFNDQAVKYVKQKPVVAVVGAIAVGYLIGRIVSRL